MRDDFFVTLGLVVQKSICSLIQGLFMDKKTKFKTIAGTWAGLLAVKRTEVQQ